MRDQQSISVLDMFKIGIGPSSSHTLGPWKAALEFANQISRDVEFIERLNVELFGSLGKTGKGHGTDIALMMGLCGEDPVSFDTSNLDSAVEEIYRTNRLKLNGLQLIEFNPVINITFSGNRKLSFHPNAMRFECHRRNGEKTQETFYSIGGGFLIREGEEDYSKTDNVSLPYPVQTAADLSKWCKQEKIPISTLVGENECSWRTEQMTRESIIQIWKVMRSSIYDGCHSTGQLPGGLKVERRAGQLNKQLLSDFSYSGYDDWMKSIRHSKNDFERTLEWVSCFALAVNEENASFGRVVTAPTNGAAGVIPAVLQYLLIFKKPSCDDCVYRFLLTASEIGSLFKKGATISAAMGGCQAEIGVSSAMAAAGLTECLGGTVDQCLMAAEIAMEHHLGLTCDPVGGLVQIPCIERNTMGAIKAINASLLALRSNPANACVPLDGVIRAMWDTARDMSDKYKETAEGGLAANIPLC